MEQKGYLDDCFTPCRSGKHLWYFPEDAEMCCNGYRRQVVLNPYEADTWLYLFGYGYKWIPEPMIGLEVSENKCS